MEQKITYAFTQYGDKSILEEEFTLFGRTLEQVQHDIQKALRNNKSFRVIVFGVETEDEIIDGHAQFIIKDLSASEAEDIIDGNLGTKCEWLDGSDETGNRYSIGYSSTDCLESCLRSLRDEGADVEYI